MQTLLRSALLCLILAVCTCRAAAAPDEAAADSKTELSQPVIDLLHTSWTAQEGAPAGISGIAQTPDGWIWIGSNSGLYKFDGVRFLRITGRQGPMASHISNIGVLKDGRLWVGYVYGGVSIQDGDGMRHFPAVPGGLPTTLVYDAALDASGRLWLATAAGSFYFDSRWHPARLSSDLPDGRVYSFLLDRQGTFWVRSQAGVFALPHGANQFERKLRVAERGILAQHPDGSIWTNSEGNANLQLVKGPDQGAALKWNPTLLYIAFGFDRDGYRWIATDVGVVRAGPAGTDTTDHRTGFDHGLTGNIVSALFEDREQNFWVATENGLDRFRKPRLRALTLPTYALANARPLAGGQNGSAWVDRFFVAAPDAVPQEFAAYHGRGLTALYRAPDGTLWGGGSGEFWTRENGERRNIPLPSDIPGNTNIFALARDGAGALWVSFGRQGLRKWADGQWSKPEGIPKPSPLATAVADPRGRLWLGFVGGQLALVDGGAVKSFDRDDGLAIGTVAQILPSGDSAWVGGENGLSYFDGKRFASVVGKGGEPFPGITGLVRARDGTLWINGSTGVSSIAPAELQRALREPGYPVRFGRLDYRDGLRGTASAVLPLPSASASDNGTLWFSTTAGTYGFVPGTLPRNAMAPPVFITSIRTDHAAYAPVGGVLLPAGTETLRLDFTALSYQAPERMEFRYQLDGVDRTWRENTGERAASYTNLGPGRYRFRVIASNNDGVWNNEGASITFEIAARPTQTVWFRAACIVLGLSILVSLYFWRVRQLRRRYSERMRERLGERERIARTLHDSFLQSVQALMMQFGLIKWELPVDHPMRLTIDRALDTADDVLSEGREHILALRLNHELSGDLEAALSGLGHILAPRHGARFVLQESGERRPLRAAAAAEAYAIGREALLNAFRHAGSDEVTVELRYTSSQFSLQVRDTGCGLNAEVYLRGQRPGHFGLVGMRERAHDVGGTLEIRSEAGKGTTVTLRLPAGSAYVSKVADKLLSARHS
jgi:signal transduction histidine kinase/ligand-binding sensor domain-containing protein